MRLAFCNKLSHYSLLHDLRLLGPLLTGVFAG
jgi:hypothetical protein